MTGLPADEAVARLREDLPVFQDQVFMNAAWSGPCSDRALQAIHDYLLAENHDGPTSVATLRRKADVDRRARQGWARLVGGTPDEIALVESTTEGMNLVFNGIDWKPGDRLVTASFEYPAILVPAFFRAQRFGLDVGFATVDPQDSPQAILDAFDRAITPGTRLVAVSHVGYADGLRLPLAEIVRMAHDRGAWVVADGAQAVGQVALHLDETGIDFYSGPSQKWVSGPEGTAFLYVRRERIPDLTPSKPSYHAVKQYRLDGSYEENFDDAARFEASSTNMGVLAGLVETLDIIEEIGGASTVEERTLALSARALSGLMSIPGVRVVSPREGPGVTGLVCFRVGDHAPDEVTCTAWERHRVLLGGRQGPDRQPHYLESTRVATGYFNTAEDVDRFLDAIRDIATNGVVDDMRKTDWWIRG